MIPYEELDKALARWKTRTQNAAAEGARELEVSGGVPAVVPRGVSGRLPPPPDSTGEIDLGDSVVESYEEEHS